MLDSISTPVDFTVDDRFLSHDAVDVTGYLARLGVPHPGPPSVGALRSLHRAHVERVAYQTADIHLGRPTTIDPSASADRIVRHGWGGYCMHLNGAFSALLAALGYQVRRHRGGVQLAHDQPAPGADANHLAVTVHGLPGPENPGGSWFVDVGLGDGLHEPLPLVTGTYRQGPFTYGLRPSPVEPRGWRFDHDPDGSFVAMDFVVEQATMADFTARHVELTTSPASRFTRVLTAYRRDATGSDLLRGCVLTRVGADAGRWELGSAAEWYATLAGRFGVTLTDVPDTEREALWERVRAAHDRWRTSRAPARERV
ncbi:Arylamine N-acetyltransferase [Streptosporangium canum]|uniref:Arylamine N-acetyltransferase n=1 Tax=Streptosporangium canum TaxID=324952 RepID=A0A1I4E1Y3_9ACTN|nr:arylamine N-acetyltransferase [Streptosporangium canum]SFK98577.1 Arylamine N-acetyltransferase [Streptosporangium canum]